MLHKNTRKRGEGGKDRNRKTVKKTLIIHTSKTPTIDSRKSA